ncbi:MAG: hypothetical protein O2973_02270 [Gemmatimonadetes bacterium]|nr:hypothetical protein [Gemmatimonadota bacterium]
MKIVTIAGLGCQVVNTLRHSASIAITYTLSPIDLAEAPALSS